MELRRLWRFRVFWFCRVHVPTCLQVTLSSLPGWTPAKSLEKQVPFTELSDCELRVWGGWNWDFQRASNTARPQGFQAAAKILSAFHTSMNPN